MGHRILSRRNALKLGAAAGAYSMISGCSAINKAISGSSGGSNSSCAKLTDIQHVVILIQENRSFDHYFGNYRGARGFSESSNAYKQPYPANTTASPAGLLYPFHLDSSKWNAACTHDIDHGWIAQHQSWDNGANDGFVTSHIPINANDAVLTMGYYTRADLPYYYAVADAFTLCDDYYCSVIGPTDPNRLYTMAASIDPDGKNGGPLLQTLVGNRSSMYGKLTYTTRSLTGLVSTAEITGPGCRESQMLKQSGFTLPHLVMSRLATKPRLSSMDSVADLFPIRNEYGRSTHAAFSVPC